MWPFVKLWAGLLCCLLGLGYLLRPDVIARVNSVIKNTILNDSYLALERKKWGTFFILIGCLLLYLGATSLGK